MFNAAVLTISDKGWRGERIDMSGRLVAEIISGLPAQVVKYEVIPDEPKMISDKLREWADSGHIDLVLTTGGTGLGPRDVTPEATLAVASRLVPGLAEAMRAESLKVTPHGMLSRAVAGIRKRCLIINLPGSPKAVKENLTAIMPALPHALEVLRGEAEECAAPERPSHAH